MHEFFQQLDDGTEVTEQEKELTEYGIDFKTLTLTGEKVTGTQALKVWCFFALKIPRYRYRAFTWQYGSEMQELVGKSYGRDYTESEIARMVKDCLCVHPNISELENVNVKFEKSKVLISFRVISDFGNIDFNFEEEDAFV